MRFEAHGASYFRIGLLAVAGALYLLGPAAAAQDAENPAPAGDPPAEAKPAEGQPAKPLVEESGDGEDLSRPVTIVVANEPFTGYLIPPPTSLKFNFKLAETGDVLNFTWSSLAPSEQKRVQRMLGMDVDDGKMKWGKTVPCVLLKLKSKKTVWGTELRDRALPGYRCLKNATQVMQIPKQDIDEERKVERRESELYSALERYDLMLLEKPPAPDDAQAHYEFAKEASNMGLYDKALDHYDMAATIDSRIKERTEEFRKELVLRYADQQAERVYLEIVRDINNEDYASALDKIELVKRNFPNSEYYTKVDGLVSNVEKKANISFQKKVIFMYYTLFNDLIQLKLGRKIRVDEKGRPVPSVPGKLITTKFGHFFRGELVSQDPAKTVIALGGTNYEIDAKDILSVQDIDLSKSFSTKTPTFAELKAYVTDKAGGLGKDIVTTIAQKLRVEEQRVTDVWEGRFNRTAKYVNGQMEKSPIYTSLHKAYYGKGAWLRDGVQLLNAPNQGTSRNTGRNSGGNTSRNSGYGTNTARTDGDKPAYVNPETSDDPEVWWGAQQSDVKLHTLRAMGAEKLFRIKEPVTGKPCPSCGAKGVIEIWDAFGTRRWERCPTCRGLCILPEIFYE